MAVDAGSVGLGMRARSHLAGAWRLAFAAMLLPAALAAAPAFAQAQRYELDPVHTRVVFAISHAGYSQAVGAVSGSTGTLEFDPDDWTSARVQVSVPLARLDLGDDKWNKAALASNLLDAAKHPEATFASTRVEPVDATHAAVFGTLSLHGVEREVRLDVAFNQLKRYPLPPFRRTIGFSATAAISRKDFGIDAWPSVIGDRVELRIEAEARRVHGNGPADADAGHETPATQDGAASEGTAAEPAIPAEAAPEATPETSPQAPPTDAAPPAETPPPAGEDEPVTPTNTAVAIPAFPVAPTCPVIPSAARDLSRSLAPQNGSLAALGMTSDTGTPHSTTEAAT
jgi:polyisoprenoid-binding protein YceI